MFADILAILAPVFITAGLGYFWARAGKHFDTNLVTSIVTVNNGNSTLFFALRNAGWLFPAILPYWLGAEPD